MFDNQCYATTPSSSNGNSDQDQSSYGQRGPAAGGPRHPHRHQGPNVTPTPGSPTSRLLLEYEMHLRNTLAKGMDAESYSLHTFEALLSQSMENLGKFLFELAGNVKTIIYRNIFKAFVVEKQNVFTNSELSNYLPSPEYVMRFRESFLIMLLI